MADQVEGVVTETRTGHTTVVVWRLVMRRLPLLFALLAMSASCDKCNVVVVNQIPPATEQADVFPQKGAAQVDILWMIDNSGSMAAEQEKVAGRFNQFFNQLIVSGVDYHIGVITSDPADGGILRQYTGPVVANCQGCRFIEKSVACPNPAVDVSDLVAEADIEARLLAECPAQLVFRKMIKVGTGGSAFEEGFVQASAAVGARTVNANTGFPDRVVPTENEGFIRAEASLYMVFVSDEEEGAKADGTPVRYYQRLFEGLKTAGNENNIAVAAITGYPTGVNGSPAPPAPIDEVCAILQTTFDNNAANDDPRAAAVKDALREFRTNGCTDVESTIGDDNAFAEVGGRYIELACRTGGVIANMCEADYSTALDALGANAAGLLRKFTISLPGKLANGSDCVLFGDGEDDDKNVKKLDCDGDGVVTGDNDGPMCVVAQCVGETSTRVMVRGVDWVWEDSTSSVRFSGRCVPAPTTEVTISYGLRSDTDTSCGGG